MIKKIAAALIGMGLLLGCAGCQLALPEEADAAATEPDRLIGAYVTREYIDLFDMESYLANNIGSIGSDMVVSAEDAQAYTGRLWAEPVPGEDGLPEDWVFPVEGMGLYLPYTEDLSGTYIGSHIDPGVVSAGTHVTSTDDGDWIELDFTLYSVAGKDIEFYCNPVYQTPEGDVYLTSGNGMLLNSQLEAQDSVFAVTLSEDRSQTADGQTTSASGSTVTFHAGVMLPPERIELIQLDGDSRELRRDGYDPDAMPDSVTLDPACESVLVQTHRRGADGEAAVTRELVELTGENDLVTTFTARDDGICVPRTTALSRG